MSRQPSPGPSHYPPSAQHNNNRQKGKNYTQGIAAGAEDAKYKAKYRELKKKVREIELDNDKLQIKVLQSKRNIQRLRLERAILYERLSSRQAFSNAHPVQPTHSYPPPHNQPYGHPQSRESLESNFIVLEPNDHHGMEHYRAHGFVIRVMAGPDGQPVHVAEMPPAPPLTPGGHTPTSAQPRYASGHRGDARQQQQIPPPVQHLEPSPAYDRHPNSHGAYAHAHSPAAPSHFRSRSRGAHPVPTAQIPSPSYTHPQPPAHEAPSPTYRDYPHAYPPTDRERRIHRSYDAPATTSHLPPPAQPLPGTHSPPRSHSHSHSPTSSRGSTHVHNHQRLGPGTNINNYGQPERERERLARDRDREQEWERERSRRLRDHERSPGGYAAPRRYAPDEHDDYVRGYHPGDVPLPASRSVSPRSRSLTPARRSPRDVYYERAGAVSRARSEGEPEGDVDMEDVRGRGRGRERAAERAD
ncbi:hypothetical protein BC834DRAFT_968348 [Gloeopeniophorella convolvens]|nr:hypothetical protein BC834DRAFT_968348 [Gloeopeniophorella convolvens]